MVKLPPPSVPIFDPSRIPDFVEPMDRKNLLLLFLESSQDTLQKLKADLELSKTDLVSMRPALHGLKGAAVSVGASAVAQIAKVMENDLAKWDANDAKVALKVLEKTLSDTQIAMGPWLK